MTTEFIHLTPKPVSQHDAPAPATTPVQTEKQKAQEQADRIADEAAQRAGNREERYDQDHGIITK